MTSTFEAYAERLEAGRLQADGAADRDELSAVIGELDDDVAGVEGHGFEPTPFAPVPALAEAVGIGSAELWVKDETGNVSGSHKARHLFGVALAHRLAGAAEADGPPYAIASCGNAALAAAVVAKAVGRPLDVFVPTWANEAVVARITELGGRVVHCEREPGVPGDPAHHAMLAAIEDGAVPFSCQGTETPATIDGGRTLAWEMVDALVEHDGGPPARLDRLFVQVGGGALATAAVTGLAAAVGRGELARLPRVHAVQPEGNHPLVRAWDTLMLELRSQARASGGRDRDYFLDRIVAAQAAPQGTMDNRLRANMAGDMTPMGDVRLRESVSRLRDDPERYMRAWDSEPVSYASGILDDITYDWIDIVEAMLGPGDGRWSPLRTTSGRPTGWPIGTPTWTCAPPERRASEACWP